MKSSHGKIAIIALAFVGLALICWLVVKASNPQSKGQIVQDVAPSTQGPRTISLWLPEYVFIDTPRNKSTDDGRDYQMVDTFLMKMTLRAAFVGVIDIDIYYMPNRRGYSLEQCADAYYATMASRRKGQTVLLRQDRLSPKSGMERLRQVVSCDGIITRTTYIFDPVSRCCYTLDCHGSDDTRCTWEGVEQMEESFSVAPAGK